MSADNREYEAPELTRYGTITEVTQGSGTGNADFAGSGLGKG